VDSPKQPLVSVIVPTYNSQKTIKQCLLSIKNQTYKEIETIVIDRHSIDKTMQIARKFKAKLLDVAEERSTAKNNAAKKAQGQFLLFVDSDMMLSPKIVEECVNKSLETGADAVVIPLRSISQSLISECRKKERESLSSLTELMDAPRFFRKNAFLKTGGYDEEVVCGEDYDLTKRFKKLGYKIGKITSELNHFEDGDSLHDILSKDYYYGRTLPTLIKKDPRETVKRYANIRLASIKTTGTTFKNAKLLLSFVSMKLLEYMAYFAGILTQLIQSATHRQFCKTLKAGIARNKFAIINFAILTLISITIFRNFLLSAEWPGGGDVIGFISRAYLYGKDFRWLYVWHQYSFGFVEGINFMDFFFMITYWIFQDPSWTVKIFMFLSYLTAAFSMYFFAYRYIRNHVAALSASLVYILNQWFFSQLTEAHVDIVYSYALAPVIFLLLDNALKTTKFRDIVLASLGLSLFITSFHPECIVIYGVFLLLFTFSFLLFSLKNQKFKPILHRFFKVFMPAAVLVSLLSAFFLIPFLFNVRAPYLHSSYVYPIEDSFGHSYSNITDAFVLRAVERWGYVNIVDVYTGLVFPDFPVYLLLIVIFVLAYCALLFRRDRYTLFFAFSAVISIFMAKGPNSPFGQFFIWAWGNVPHFGVFRAANRWVMMAVFSNAFLVSILTSYLVEWIKTRGPFHTENGYFNVRIKDGRSVKIRKVRVFVGFLNSFSRTISSLAYLLSIILLMFILLSGFLSSFFFFSQGLQVYTPSQNDLAPFEWLASQSNDYKVISVCRSHSEWLNPLSSETDFSSGGFQTPLGWTHDIGSDSSFIDDKPVLQDGGWNFKSRQFIDYLRFRLARGCLSDNLLKMLGPFNYYYVVLPSYITNQTRDFFLKQKGYRVIYNQSALILQNDYVSPQIFAGGSSMFAVGGFELLDELCKIESFDLSKNTLYFAPEFADNEALLFQKINETQMFGFSNSDILDLAIISLGEDSTIIYAGEYGFSSLDTAKYWTKCSSWRTLGTWVIGGDVLTTSGKNKIDIPFELNSDGVYNLFLRVGFAPSRGQLDISVDGEFVGTICPLYPLMSKLGWINASSLNLAKGKHFITLENDGTGFNDIDAIAIFRTPDLETQENEILNQLQNFQGRLLYVQEAENAFLDNSNDYWRSNVSPYNGVTIYSDSLGLNVASLATANATSECEFMGSQNAVDGDLGTRWTSEKNVLPQVLELTWNTTQRLVGVRVVFENAFATDYAIQTWNGASWINQTIVTENNELEKVHQFPEMVETNKLRIYVTNSSIYNRVSIWELEASSPEIASVPFEVIIPKQGEYMLAARVDVGPDYGKLCFKVNEQIYSISCNSSVKEFEWREIGPFSLSAGNTTISIGNLGLAEIDEILLYSLKEGEDYLSLDALFNSSNPNVSITYENINPCKYQVHVSANESFTLIFSEAYDPLWTASDGKNVIASTPAYSLVNSFHINRTGEFDLIIYFEGQTRADVGMMISASTFILIVLAVLIPKKFVERFKKRVSIGRLR
jgi:glycosyltransferase involved in cell wall biosynthesis